MEPGNARRLPVPRIFLMSDVVNAADVLYRVPQSTARKILIMCCKGNAFVTPKGKANIGESKTAAAVKMAEKMSFLRTMGFSFIDGMMASFLVTGDWGLVARP